MGKQIQEILGRALCWYLFSLQQNNLIGCETRTRFWFCLKRTNKDFKEFDTLTEPSSSSRLFCFSVSNVKSKKDKKSGDDSESDVDDSDMDDLDDEEVSLGSMDEEDFGDELEEEGGMFMDPDGDEEGDDDDDDEGKKYDRVQKLILIQLSFEFQFNILCF